MHKSLPHMEPIVKYANKSLLGSLSLSRWQPSFLQKPKNHYCIIRRVAMTTAQPYSIHHVEKVNFIS